MRILVALALLALTGFATQPVSAETFAQVIGPTRVRAIVGEVTNTVIEQQAPSYRREIILADRFIDITAKKAGEVETSLQRFAAEWRLRGLYGVFLTHLIANASGRVPRGPIVLDEGAVETYIAVAQKTGRCGEIPCTNECKPCNKQCDRCP